MGAQERSTQTVEASRVGQEWGRLLTTVIHAETRVRVEEDGKPVAAIVSADDLDRLNRMDAERVERLKIIDQIRDKFRDVPPEEIEREVARAIAEVRAENRSRQPAQQA